MSKDELNNHAKPEADEENEEVEKLEKGQRGEAQKAMQNMGASEEVEESTPSKGAPNANRLTESLNKFKEEVVRQKVRIALKNRELEKIQVKEEEVELIAKELDTTLPQATQLLKKHQGDFQAALSAYINSSPCSIHKLIEI